MRSTFSLFCEECVYLFILTHQPQGLVWSQKCICCQSIFRSRFVHKIFLFPRVFFFTGRFTFGVSHFGALLCHHRWSAKRTDVDRLSSQMKETIKRRPKDFVSLVGFEVKRRKVFAVCLSEKVTLLSRCPAVIKVPPTSLPRFSSHRADRGGQDG